MLQINYLPLPKLIEMRWEDNPKLHATDIIADSVKRYGFNDPIGVDYEHNVVVEGHGRIELLQHLSNTDHANPPNNIFMDDQGIWQIPTAELHFDDINTAYKYALAHNRANTKDFNRNDYRMDKLEKMRNAGQLDLLGFENATTLEATLPKFELPELKPFDATILPDAPEQQVVAPQSFVMMVTFPSQEMLRKALEMFTYGERKSLPGSARLCSIEGAEMLDKWQHSLSQIETTVKTVPATQFGIPSIAEDKQVEVFSNESWDAPKKKEKPESVGGLCVGCGGSGCEKCNFTGEIK